MSMGGPSLQSDGDERGVASARWGHTCAQGMSKPRRAHRTRLRFHESRQGEAEGHQGAHLGFGSSATARDQGLVRVEEASGLWVEDRRKTRSDGQRCVSQKAPGSARTSAGTRTQGPRCRDPGLSARLRGLLGCSRSLPGAVRLLPGLTSACLPLRRAGAGEAVSAGSAPPTAQASTGVQKHDRGARGTVTPGPQGPDPISPTDARHSSWSDTMRPPPVPPSVPSPPLDPCHPGPSGSSAAASLQGPQPLSQARLSARG